MDAEALFRGPCDFVAGAADEEGIPALGLPEFAFAGRSNVGKSSLLNALAGRKTLARTSSQPGRTQQLNFFNLGETLMLVDLPGYGFARAGKDRVKDWSELTLRYLKGRPQLKRVCLLVDARHEPKKIDDDYMTIFDDAAVAYFIVMTKCDKLSPNQLDARRAEYEAIAKKHPAAMTGIIATSSQEKIGLEELRAALVRIAMEG